MTPVEVALGRVFLRVVHAADAAPRVKRIFPRGGGPVPAPSLAVSAGRGFDDGLLNALLASALLRVVREAVPVQAPASASMAPFSAVRGFDAGVSGGLDAGSDGRVGENAATCSVDDFGAAAARSSAGGAAVCQVMNPGLSGVVPSSLVEGATISSNRPRHDLCPLHF